MFRFLVERKTNRCMQFGITEMKNDVVQKLIVSKKNRSHGRRSY